MKIEEKLTLAMLLARRGDTLPMIRATIELVENRILPDDEWERIKEHIK